MTKFRLPRWAKQLSNQWGLKDLPTLDRHPVLLRKGIRLLEEARSSLKADGNRLQGQPFDLHLLNVSALYRNCRKIFIEGGGRFIPSLVSTPRSLNSIGLLKQEIQYSPIEEEYVWLASDPIQSKKPDALLNLRSYASSLFHEQSHRILWRILPPAPRDPKGLRRYLNFAESLVITTDMALGDQLGPGLASLFYLLGVIYDPGTQVYVEIYNRRNYRNYLQAALHGTYLNLELYDQKDIPKVIKALFPQLGLFARRAAQRSCNLDQAFIQGTNLTWQKQHQKTLAQVLCEKKGRPLFLSDRPQDNFQQYLIAEKWFDLMGI